MIFKVKSFYTLYSN